MEERGLLNTEVQQYLAAKLKADIAECEKTIAALEQTTHRVGKYWETKPEERLREKIRKYERMLSEIQTHQK
jgi:hypothetical protein